MERWNKIINQSTYKLQRELTMLTVCCSMLPFVMVLLGSGKGRDTGNCEGTVDVCAVNVGGLNWPAGPTGCVKGFKEKKQI